VWWLARDTLLQMLGRLGLPMATDKIEGPAMSLVFLGFELDSVAMEVRLPSGKLEELRELIMQWQGRRTRLVKELESLVGKLAHAVELKAARRLARDGFALNVLRIGGRKL